MNYTRNYDQELCELYKIVCEETSDLNLRIDEIKECFYFIIGLIITPRIDTSHPDFTTELFLSPDNCNIESIKTFRAKYNNKDISDINLTLSEYNICKDQKLPKILSRFLKSNSLPPYNIGDCQNYMKSLRKGTWLKSSTSEHAYTRERKEENGRIIWSITSLNGKSKTIPDAAYVWAEKQGLCRFLTMNGKWGYIDTNTFDIFLLADNIIKTGDFCNFRALALVSEEFAQEIDINDKFCIDYNPYKLCWAHIDMRGNIIKKYTQASEYNDNVATVCLREGDFWGFTNNIEKKYKNPYENIEVDIMGNPLPKYQQIIDETLRKIEEDKREKELNGNSTNHNYEDEDSIMEALESGYGDVYGY